MGLTEPSSLDGKCPVIRRQEGTEPQPQASNRLRLSGDRRLRLLGRGDELRLQTVREALDELLRDVLDDPAPVLRDLAGQPQVGGDVDPLPPSSAASDDSIVAFAAPRPRDSRAWADRLALRAASSASSRLTSVSNVSLRQTAEARSPSASVGRVIEIPVIARLRKSSSSAYARAVAPGRSH